MMSVTCSSCRPAPLGPSLLPGAGARRGLATTLRIACCRRTHSHIAPPAPTSPKHRRDQMLSQANLRPAWRSTRRSQGASPRRRSTAVRTPRSRHPLVLILLLLPPPRGSPPLALQAPSRAAQCPSQPQETQGPQGNHSQQSLRPTDIDEFANCTTTSSIGMLLCCPGRVVNHACSSSCLSSFIAIRSGQTRQGPSASEIRFQIVSSVSIVTDRNRTRRKGRVLGGRPLAAV